MATHGLLHAYKNFSRKGERFITFGRILSLNDLEFPYLASIPEKWSFVIDIIHQLCKVNYTDYMIVMTIIDYLVGNEDRHLNNFGVITDDNSYRLAPLFDFGLGLFEHDRRYEGRPFRECLKLMECKPFHKNNSKVIDFLKEKYPLEDYLPEHIDMREIEFPSGKATSYVLNRCRYLGVSVDILV